MRSVIAAILISSVALPACTDSYEVKNGRPRVTWAALEAIDEGEAALTLWLQDPDGDAVDVSITWTAGAAGGAFEPSPGSAPLSGLPTQLGLDDPAGQAHRVLWNIAAVPAGPVTLTLVVDDRPHAGDDGDAYRVEGLDPRLGGGPVTAVPVE